MTNADPTSGSPSAIRTSAKRHRARATALDDARNGIADTAHGLASSGWTGSAHDRFATLAASLGPSLATSAALSEFVAESLDDYADGVERIQDEAARVQSARATAEQEQRRLSSERRNLVSATTGDGPDESETVRLHRISDSLEEQRTMLTQLDARWDELLSERKRLDESTASALTGVEAVGVTTVAARSAQRMTDSQLLTWLAGLRPAELLALADDDAVQERLASVDDPVAVAAWWMQIGGDFGRGTREDHSALQDTLVTAFPALIGNLNGVAYWARDRANRVSLERLLKSASGDDHSAYKNINAALSKYNGTQLITLVPQHPPLAAVSVGDLDAAEDVTYVVPGMDSDTRNMTVVEKAAYNLRVRQKDYVADAAVVAWINYETPTVKTVLHGDLARAGSERLGADLAGFNASRGETKGHLNVVGHSYGSTTSSLTLAAHDYGVTSYVTAGSAGLEREIKTASDIHSDSVFAAQAPRRIAPFPGDNYSWVGQTFSMSRRDPASPSFGATYLPTAGLPDDPTMQGVTRHDPIWHDDMDHKNDYGYFDKNTESLDNIARATTGQVKLR